MNRSTKTKRVDWQIWKVAELVCGKFEALCMYGHWRHGVCGSHYQHGLCFCCCTPGLVWEAGWWSLVENGDPSWAQQPAWARSLRPRLHHCALHNLPTPPPTSQALIPFSQAAPLPVIPTQSLSGPRAEAALWRGDRRSFRASGSGWPVAVSLQRRGRSA